MRVFDFDGVVEAIGEVREELEKVVREPTGSPCLHPALSPEKRRPREEVADSEDEDGGLDNEEEDMLYGGVSKPEVPHTAPGTFRPGIEDSESKEVAENEGGKISTIVIDNLTQVLNPLLKSNYVQGPHIPSLLSKFCPDGLQLSNFHLCSPRPPNHLPPQPHRPNTQPYSRYHPPQFCHIPASPPKPLYSTLRTSSQSPARSPRL